MEIRPCGTTPTLPAPEDYFTGQVWQDAVSSSTETQNLRSLLVTFAPGGRTHWHTHPLGQTLYVTSGCGRIQSWGGPLQTISACDVIWIPPGEKHWHGAGPDTLMCHLALQEAEEGVAAQWLEAVSDTQYRGET